MWTRRRIAIGWMMLAAWVLAVAIWATRPATDHIPTGVVDGKNTSIVVECGAPFDGSSGPSEPLPVIEPPRELQHVPCQAQHRGNQISLVIDLVVALAAAAVLLAATKRHWRPPVPHTTEPAAV